MAREKKKDAKIANFNLDIRTIKALDKHLVETGIPKTTIGEKALSEYLTNRITRRMRLKYRLIGNCRKLLLAL